MNTVSFVCERTVFDKVIECYSTQKLIWNHFQINIINSALLRTKLVIILVAVGSLRF